MAYQKIVWTDHLEEPGEVDIILHKTLVWYN